MILQRFYDKTKSFYSSVLLKMIERAEEKRYKRDSARYFNAISRTHANDLIDSVPENFNEDELIVSENENA